jgi:hypothetical protein
MTSSSAWDRFEDKIDVNNYISGRLLAPGRQHHRAKWDDLPPVLRRLIGCSYQLSDLLFSDGNNFRTDSVFGNGGPEQQLVAQHRSATTNHGETQTATSFDDHRARASVSPRSLRHSSGSLTPATQSTTALANSNNPATAGAQAGTPSILVYIYDGPDINPDPDAPTWCPDEAIARVACSNPSQAEQNALLVQCHHPWFRIKIPHSLASPSADEGRWASSSSDRTGAHDYINRDFHDLRQPHRRDHRPGGTQRHLDFTHIENNTAYTQSTTTGPGSLPGSS